MPENQKKEKISDSLKKLEELVRWFESREDVDVEEGLEKVKQGAALIKELKGKLKRVENEFEEIKKELAEDNADL